MGWIMLYLLFASIVIFSFLAFMAAIGIIVSPFAAYMTYRRAEQIGYNPIRYAVLGSLFSLCLFLPWTILMGKLSKTDKSTKWDLSILYFCWLFGPIAITFVIAFTGYKAIQTQFVFIAGFLMLLIWIGSLVWWRVSNKKDKLLDHSMKIVETTRFADDRNAL